MNSSNVIYVNFQPTPTLKDASETRETASRNKELAKELKKAIISNNFSSTKAILQTPQIYVDQCIYNPLRFAMVHDVSYSLFALILDHLSDSLENLIKKYPTWGAALIISAANEEREYFPLLMQKYANGIEQRDGENPCGLRKKAKSLDCNNSRAVFQRIIEQTKYFRDSDGNDALHRACMSPYKEHTDLQMWAVDYGIIDDNLIVKDFQEVENFIMYSPNPNALNKNGYSPLALAIEEDLDDAVICRIILKCKGLDLNFRNKFGEGLLHLVCKNKSIIPNKIKIIKELIRAGVDINAKNNLGQTPIFFLSCKHELETLKFMHRCGASLAEIDNNGCSLLNAYEVVPLIEYVLERSNLTIDYKNKSNEDVFCALSRELFNHTQDKIDFFKKYGRNINSQLSNGSYPILEFLKNCPIDLKVIDHIKYMVIVYGLDLRVVDDNGHNAAIIVSISPANKPKPIVYIIYLLERAVDFDYTHVDAKGRNILHHLFQNKEQFDCTHYSSNKKLYVTHLITLIALFKTIGFDFAKKDDAHSAPLEYLKRLKLPELIEAYNVGLIAEFSDNTTFKKRNALINGVNLVTGLSFTDSKHLDWICTTRTVAEPIDTLYYLHKTFKKNEVIAILNQESDRTLMEKAIDRVNSYWSDKEIIFALYHCGAQFPISTKRREMVIEGLIKINLEINPMLFDEFKERCYLIKAITSSITKSYLSASSDAFIQVLIDQLGEIRYEEKFQFLLTALAARFSDLEYVIRQKLISLDFANKKFIECIKNYSVEFFELVEENRLKLIVEKLGDFLIYVDQAMKPDNHVDSGKKRYGALEYFCKLNINSYKKEKGHATWPDLIEYLVEQLGYDVNEYIEYTPLASLVLSKKSLRGNKIVWAEYLIDMGADINLGSGPNKAPPLAIAIVEGNKDFYELFMTGRCAKNDERYKELTHILDTHSWQYSRNIIYGAVSDGEMILSDFAKEAGFKRKIADIEAKTIDGDTPLLYALKSAIECNYRDESWQLIERFVNDHNPNLLATNNRGENVLHIIATANISIGSLTYGEILRSIIKKAVTKGIDLDAKDVDNNTPLYLALSTKKLDLFHMLVELGADPSVKAGKENLPLVYYAYNKELFNLLIDHLDMNKNHLEDLYYMFCKNFGSTIHDERMLDYFLRNGYSISHIFKDDSLAMSLLAKGWGFNVPPGYNKEHDFNKKTLKDLNG